MPKAVRKNLLKPKVPKTAREGLSQALVGPAGEGEVEPKVIIADAPPNIIHTYNWRDRAKWRVAQWAMMRSTDQKMTNVEIAAKLGVCDRTLRKDILDGTRAGWLQFDDPIDQIEYDIVPKVVRNLNKFLDEGDKTVTIETAKGTIFKTYAESKGVSDSNTTVLALKLELPGGESKILAGKVVGRPKDMFQDE